MQPNCDHGKTLRHATWVAALATGIVVGAARVGRRRHDRTGVLDFKRPGQRSAGPEHVVEPTLGERRSPSIRILLGDVNTAGHQAIRAALDPEGFEIVGETRNRHTLVDMAIALRPAVVIVACDRLSMRVLTAAREILGPGREAQVLLLIGHAAGRRIRVAFRAGIRGLVVKADSTRELARAVRAVAAGRMFLSADAGRTMTERYLPQPEIMRSAAR